MSGRSAKECAKQNHHDDVLHVLRAWDRRQKEGGGDDDDSHSIGSSSSSSSSSGSAGDGTRARLPLLAVSQPRLSPLQEATAAEGFGGSGSSGTATAGGSSSSIGLQLSSPSAPSVGSVRTLSPTEVARRGGASLFSDRPNTAGGRLRDLGKAQQQR
jgi:hypothetical protein